MSKSLNLENKWHLWDYYIKLSNFEAQCMYCEKKYCYINHTNFQTHVLYNHVKIWKYEDERKQIKWPWKYFKYSNEFYSQCLICDANVLPTFDAAKNHLTLHSSQQQESDTYKFWPQKYWIIKDNFQIECNVCHKNVAFQFHSQLNHHIKLAHSDKLKDTQKTRHTVGSSQCVSLLKTDTTVSLTIATKKYLWNYYIKLPDFKAQCMFCEQKYCYITLSLFQTHVARNHAEIWKYEEEKKQIRWPWRYFKYFNDLSSQCIICDATVLSTTESVENHLTSHSLQQLENNIYRDWKWKYVIQKDDFKVECNICHNNIVLGIQRFLHIHIKMKHLNKLEDMQEMKKICNTAGSSKCVMSHQAPKSFIPQIFVTKEHMWNYYIKLPEFKAQCMFCKKKYMYVQTFCFQRHIVKNHKKIYEFEKDKKLTEQPWTHFKYFNNMHVQCIICNANVLPTPEAVKNHLSVHSLRELEHNIYRCWPLKYCTQRSDFEVKCNICHNNVVLSIQSCLKYHITIKHSDKLNDMDKTCNTAGSSKRILPFETNTTSKLILSLKDCYVLLKKCPHYDLYM